MRKVIAILIIAGATACNGHADTAAEKDSLRRDDSLNKAVDSAKLKMDKMIDSVKPEVKMGKDSLQGKIDSASTEVKMK